MPIFVSGGPAHRRPYATTPAVPVKSHLTVIARYGSPAHSRQCADTPAVPVKNHTQCSRASRTWSQTLPHIVL
eukprot:2863674-Pyramimonas_sp.AAC.1